MKKRNSRKDAKAQRKNRNSSQDLLALASDADGHNDRKKNDEDSVTLCPHLIRE